MSKISFKVELDDLVSPEKLDQLTDSTKRTISDEVGEFIVDKILEDTSKQRSAVTGQKWKGLNPDYKKTKTKIASGKANLELHGNMLDALKYRKSAEGVEVGIFTKKQAQKADGHCHLGVFGTSSLPTRQFLPSSDGTLRPGIMNQVARVAKDLVDGAPKRKRSKTTFTRVAATLLGGNEDG